MYILRVFCHTKGIDAFTLQKNCVKGCHLQRTRKLLQAASSQGENVREEDEPPMLPNMTFGPEIRRNGVVESEQEPESVVEHRVVESE